MSLFKKKEKGPGEIRLNENQFAAVLEKDASDVHHKYLFNAEGDNYNLLYRDGQFLGMPCPFGGNIYPFSVNPAKEGSRREKKQFRKAKIVCIAKDFNLKVFWGTETPFVLEDVIDHKAYEVGARGVFYVNINPADAARSADRFYSKLLAHRNAAMFDPEALRDFLREGFIMQIGAKIEEYIAEKNRSLANYVGLQPSEILKISEELCPKMADIFAEFGLTIVVKTSANSILQGLVVNEIVR